MFSAVAMLISFMLWQESGVFQVDRLESISVRLNGRIKVDLAGRMPVPDELALLRLANVQSQLRSEKDEIPKLIKEVESEFPTSSLYFQSPSKALAYRNALRQKMKAALSPIDLLKIEAGLDARIFYTSPTDYLASRGIDDGKVAKFKEFFSEERTDIVERLNVLHTETIKILFAEFPDDLRNNLVVLLTDSNIQFPSPSALNLDLMRIKEGNFSKRPRGRTGVSYRLNALSEMELTMYTQHDPFSDFGNQLVVSKFPKSHPIWSDFQLHHELAWDLGSEYSKKRFEIERAGGTDAKMKLEEAYDQYLKDIQKIVEHILSGVSEKEELEFRRSNIAYEVVVFGPSSLFHNEYAGQALNFKFEDKHRKLLQKSAPKALEFLLKEIKKFERELLVEACRSAGDESIPEKQFRWLDNSLNSFPPLELFLRSEDPRR